MHKRIFLAALLAAAAVVCPAQAKLTSTCSSSSQVGNGVTTAFTFPCKFLKNSDVSVTVNGVNKNQPAHYTVSGAGNASGTITFVTAPASGALVVITRAVDNTQETSLRQSRTYDPATLETALDKLTMQMQQVDAKVPGGTSVASTSYVDAAISASITGGVVVSPNTWPLTGDGATKIFSIPNAAVNAPELYLVTIDGVYQTPATDYTVSVAAAQITFTTAPALNASVAVRSFGYARALSVGDSTSVLATNTTVPTDLKTRFARQPTVIDFGADPSCTNDSGPAFNSAMAAYKTVIVPDPNSGSCYKISTQLAIPADTKLVGMSKRTTKLLKSFNGDMVTMADGAGLYNLYLEGNGGSFTGRGIVISSTDGRQHAEHLRALNFDGAVIDFTSINAGSQSTWIEMELTRTAAGTGTGRYAITVQDSVQLTAVPRKFSHIETSGNCAFSFGGSNNTQIDNSVLGDLLFSTNTRGLKLTSSRWLNQVSATVDGHNNTIVGNDILPALTIAAGSDHIVLEGNSLNTNAVTDLSATSNGTLVTSAPTLYAVSWTASSVNPALGNGTLTGEYTRNGSQIHVTVELTIGSTTTFGTGTWRFSLPVTPPGQGGSPAVQLGSGYARQNSTATFEFVLPAVVNATSFVVLQRAGAGGPQVTNAAPFAWATSDIVRFTIDYHL